MRRSPHKIGPWELLLLLVVMALLCLSFDGGHDFEMDPVAHTAGGAR